MIVDHQDHLSTGYGIDRCPYTTVPGIDGGYGVLIHLSTIALTAALASSEPEISRRDVSKRGDLSMAEC
jgi:hypothetical protein